MEILRLHEKVMLIKKCEDERKGESQEMKIYISLATLKARRKAARRDREKMSLCLSNRD